MELFQVNHGNWQLHRASTSLQDVQRSFNLSLSWQKNITSWHTIPNIPVMLSDLESAMALMDGQELEAVSGGKIDGSKPWIRHPRF
jgi:hypothetical protein